MRAPYDPSRDDDVVDSSMYFLKRDEQYKTVKPYTARYDTEGAFPATNIDPTAYKVKIKNMRPILQDLPYEQTGFQLAEFADSRMKYEDYADTEKIRDVHIPEVSEFLKQVMRASDVYVLDFAVRRRHATFPVSTGETYEYFQPASRVHLDHTAEYMRTVIRQKLKSKAEHALKNRWHCVNVWHPLRGPVMDWPLAVCDASSVDFAADTMPGDIVDRSEILENTQIHHNPQQRWYWLPNQLPSECLIFKNADSESLSGNATHGAPHAAFDNPKSTAADFPRESIEIRFIVFWDS